MKSKGVTFHMKATERYVPVILFIKLYKVVLTFESVNEIHGCSLAESGGPWRLTSALGRLENLTFFVQIICRAP